MQYIAFHCVKHRRHSSSAFLSKSKTSPLIDNILSILNIAVSLLSEAKFLSGDFPDYLRLLQLIELRAGQLDAPEIHFYASKVAKGESQNHSRLLYFFKTLDF